MSGVDPDSVGWAELNALGAQPEDILIGIRAAGAEAPVAPTDSLPAHQIRNDRQTRFAMNIRMQELAQERDFPDVEATEREYERLERLTDPDALDWSNPKIRQEYLTALVNGDIEDDPADEFNNLPADQQAYWRALVLAEMEED